MSENDNLQKQEQYLSLLLKHRDLVVDHIDGSLNIEHFDKSLHLLLHAILDAHQNDVLLTRKSYLSFVGRYKTKKQEIVAQELAFNQISYLQVNRNDFPMLRNAILDQYLLSASSNYVKDFNKNKEQGGALFAVKQLASGIGELATTGGEKKKVFYDDVRKLNDEMWKQLIGLREGTIKEEFVSYGIKEIDDTSGVGCAPGTLTLFVADVGGGKSTVMLSIGANMWSGGKKNVLFVPLEMPQDFMYRKLWARMSNIHFDRLTHPKSLTEEELEKARKTIFEDWSKIESSFYIMESFAERTRVSIIRKEIERHIDIFKPDVVVIDYTANLQPDKLRKERNDLEIGDMLKDLRHMGRKGVMHAKGFGIISGAQLGRDALKRVRRSSSEKMGFYSEDLRGSHELSADADMIYALWPDSQQPTEKLVLCVIKSRYGKNIFSDGQRKAVLDFRPEISLIKSSSEFYTGGNMEEILKKAEKVDDMDFLGETPKPKDGTKKTNFNSDDFFA